LANASLEYSSVKWTDLENACLYGAKTYHAQFGNVNLKGVQLQKADLSFSDLEGCNMIGAQLQGAVMRGAKLQKSRLWGVKIEEKTDLRDTNWWKANFFYKEPFTPEDETRIDERLLELLFERYGITVPDNPGQLHQSVRKYLSSSNASIPKG
jgi:hypothetical protein